MFIQLQYTGYEVQSTLAAVTSFTSIISSHISTHLKLWVARMIGQAGNAAKLIMRHRKQRNVSMQPC